MKRDLNRVPIYYDMSVADVAETRLVGEMLGSAHLGETLARKLLGDLAYRSEGLGETLASVGFALVIERSRQHGARQQVEVAYSTLKRVFGIERTLVKTQVGPATRIVVKICAYNYGCHVERLLVRP